MVATSSQMRSVVPKKYVVKQGKNNLNSFKNYELIWSHSTAFALH